MKHTTKQRIITWIAFITLLPFPIWGFTRNTVYGLFLSIELLIFMIISVRMDNKISEHYTVHAKVEGEGK